MKIAPADGYGEHDAGLVQRVPKRSFGNVSNLKPGMQFQAQTSDGHARVVTVTGIQGDMVTIDGNHPLAGEHLNFEVEITEVRAATRKNSSTATFTVRRPSPLTNGVDWVQFAATRCAQPRRTMELVIST